MARRLFVWLHRWVGLATAGFLIVVGLTGSLLAFNTELERVFAPQLFAVLRSDQPRLDLGELAERAQAAAPEARLVYVSDAEPDQIKAYFEVSATPLAFDEMYLDPSTGHELGRRKRGDLSQGLINLMPFIYSLHWRLALGDVGQWILGIVAILWSIDCFIAFYLTFPITTANFWRRWITAWKIKRSAGFYRLNFDLHRAGGLWLWVMLFIFAWSSVMMNMRFVYEPVMQALFDYKPYVAPPGSGAHAPRLTWREARKRGEALIADPTRVADLQGREPISLMYAAASNSYQYEVRGPRDLFERSPQGGGTTVTFDADTGAFVELFQPTGEHAGNTIESWLYALHMARIFGIAYRIFVCALGLALVILSATGVYIWWKKRKARSLHRQGRATANRA